MADRLKNHPKVKILWNKEMVEVHGSNVVASVSLKDTQSQEISKYDAGGVFFAIGHSPNTVFLKNQLKLDDTGYIITEADSTRTQVEGVLCLW